VSTYEGCVIGLMVFADIMLFVIAAHITDILIRLRNKP